MGDFGAALGPLETFDQAAFVGDDKVPQEVCNFVLALAVIHNDYKDLVMAYAFLEEARPADPERITKDRGEHTALEIHVIRQHSSLVHELCKLIEDRSSIIDHPVFSALITRLDERAREKWNLLVAAAGTTPKDDPFTKALLLLRNKAASHFDPEEIFRGYKHVFQDMGKTPYISRGETLKNTRFFFADAAVAGYLSYRVGDAGVRPFLEGVSGLLESLNVALAQIVERFIQMRGFGWRNGRPSA